MKKRNRGGSLLISIGWMGVLCLSLWFGLVEGVAQALNLGLFMVWFACAMYALVLLTLNATIDKLAEGDPPLLPRMMYSLVGVFVVVLLVTHGHFLTGAAAALQAVLGYVIPLLVEAHRNEQEIN